MFNTEAGKGRLKRATRVGLALTYLALLAGCANVQSYTPQPGGDASRATDIADRALEQAQSTKSALQAFLTPHPIPTPASTPFPIGDPALVSREYIDALWNEPPRKFRPEKPINHGDAVAAEDTLYLNETDGTAIEIDLEALKTLRGLYDLQHAPSRIIIDSEYRDILELLENGTIRVGFALPNDDADIALNLKVIAAYELFQLNTDPTQLPQEGAPLEIVALSRALVKLAVYNRWEYEKYAELAAKFGLIAYPEYNDKGDPLYYGMVVIMGDAPAPLQIATQSSP